MITPEVFDNVMKHVVSVQNKGHNYTSEFNGETMCAIFPHSNKSDLLSLNEVEVQDLLVMLKMGDLTNILKKFKDAKSCKGDRMAHVNAITKELTTGTAYQ